MANRMPADPHNGIVPREPRAGALMRLRGGPGVSAGGLFCASPTVLEAINSVLMQRGLPTLWVQPDGTIGPTDPLTFRVEYVPSPFLTFRALPDPASSVA